MERAEMKASRWILPLILACWGAGAGARPIAPSEVPEPLRPWIDWVLHGEEARACPFLYHSAEERRCAWPGALSLQLDAGGGRFDAQWTVYARSWIALPGSRERWPQAVTVDGAPAVVLPRDGAPSIELSPGTVRVAGTFEWSRLPESLQIPAGTALVRVTVDGEPIAFPDVNAAGVLWLKRREDQIGRDAGEADSLELRVFRRVVDEVPLQVTTLVRANVAGRGREVLIGPVLLDGMIPMSLEGPLPARLEPDGRLRLQIRPGRFDIVLTARASAEPTSIPSPDGGESWPTEEIWAFDARNHLRLVEIEGVTAVDPRQVELPEDWEDLPTYRLKSGDVMELKVIRRGDPDPEPDRLSLDRTLWLDFDGGGYTVNDAITGSMTRAWRLEAGAPLVLGQVILDGEPQFITRRQAGGARGVEVRRGAVNLSADSRWEGATGALATLGWEHDFHGLRAVLNLPPGWTLFAASGVDEAPGTWLRRWTLLDLFLVLIAAMAAARLWGWRTGAVLLATLVLIWHQPAAPRLVWLHILAAVALLRVLPAGRIRALVAAYRNLSLLALVGITVPFLVTEIRTGLYPQLERPWQQTVAGGAGDAVTDIAAEAPVVLERDFAGMADETRVMRKALVAPAAPAREESVVTAQKRGRDLAMVDPNARIQTGPGLPRWEWTRIALRWTGPVERDQALHLWLCSPRVNLFLTVLRVALLAWLAWLLAAALRARKAPPAPASGATAAAAALLIPVMALMPVAGARAELPSPELLEELKQRLLTPPECLPECAELPRMQLDVAPSALVLRLEVLAAEDVAVPIPADLRHWAPAAVSVDGAAADQLLRTQGDALWLLLREGRRQVILSGPLPLRESVDLPLPLRPRQVRVATEGWTVEGVHEDGRADAQLRLVRMAGEAAPGMLSAPEPIALPPFLHIERTLVLGLQWRVETRVVRVSPAGTAALAEVPLLAGESVTTAGIEVAGGRVKVNLTPGAQVMAWESVLEERGAIELLAPETTAWIEVWRLDAGPIWHVEASGIAVVHHQDPGGRWLPQWRPWPGERVALTVTRPEGVPGETLTIDQSRLSLRPGKRATDAELALSARSSRGGQHAVTLPEEARLQSVTIDGVAQPVRQDGRVVVLPLEPGAREFNLAWREPRGISTRFATSEIDLGAPNVNASIDLAMAQDRWVLLTGGPRLGPAVLFWGALIVIALAALALGRVSLTPLGSTSWMLLGVGLSQVNVWLALIVVGWLLALGLRARFGSGAGKTAFNLMQVGLAALTLAAAAILFQAIEQGLLGTPEMQIAGNGSSAHRLLWYQDRSDASLPRAMALSAPLMAYRLLMLAWALWLAFALLGWLRWGWSCYASGGLWRPFRVFKPVAAKAPGA
jgi:hypothetical protein